MWLPLPIPKKKGKEKLPKLWDIPLSLSCKCLHTSFHLSVSLKSVIAYFSLEIMKIKEMAFPLTSVRWVLGLIMSQPLLK